MLDGNKKRFLVDFELALKFIFIRPIRKVSLSNQNQMHGNVKRGEVMQINSFHHAPSYVQGGIPSLAALPHESARKPLTEDLQPAGFDDLSSSQVEDLEKAIEMAKERLKNPGPEDQDLGHPWKGYALPCSLRKQGATRKTLAGKIL
jgi:hypothetical protein